MKTPRINSLVLSASLSGLLIVGAQATTITTIQDGNLNDGTTWVGGVAPVSGVDSIAMAHNLTILTDFVIASGQSMISTAGIGRLGAAQLTVSTGGTLDLTSGTGLAESSGGGHLTIEAGATARAFRYWNDEASYTNEWIANSSGVTTFEVVDRFSLRGTNSVLRVDLDAYDVATYGTTLVLVDYGSILLQSQAAGDNGWASVELSDGWSADLELSYDLGGGDMAVALTNITAAVPEPSAAVLLSVAGLTLGLRRRR